VEFKQITIVLRYDFCTKYYYVPAIHEANLIV